MEYDKIQKQRSKRQRTVTTFYGLNYSNNFKEGEMEQCRNLSTRMFPYISPRETMEEMGSYNRPTSIFAWGGLVVVDGTSLIYNGNVVGNVTPGEKQFAVVNTKLCIFPDKKYLDLNGGTLRPLGGQIITLAGGTQKDPYTSFTWNTITISDKVPVIDKEVSDTPFSTETPEKITVYTSLSYDKSTGTWTRVPSGGIEKLVEELAVGDLTIPAKNAGGGYAMRTRTGESYDAQENDDGVYYKITNVKADPSEQEFRWEKYDVSTSWYTYYTEGSMVWATGGAGGTQTAYPGYRFNSSTGTYTNTGSPITLSASNPGSGYSASGSTLRYYTMDKYEQLEVYKQGVNGPYYESYDSKGSTFYGYVYGPAGAYPNGGTQDGFWYSGRTETKHSGMASIGYDVYDAGGANGTFTSQFAPGDIVHVDGSSHVISESKELKITAVSDYVLTFEGTPFSAGPELASITIYKPVPDLDYICSSDNRLWGVSNKDRTIYASALGLPGDFYVFEGVDTDSYAVAVGSDGDFTGIIRYNNGVCCWKERTLHKIMGSFPSEYQMATYNINGLQAGSNKSMQIINETLYYKGVSGFYSYNGYIPQLISYNFGNVEFRYVVSGADTQRYYMSAQNDAGEWGVWTYDTIHQLWLQEGEHRALDFTNKDGTILMLEESGMLYSLNTKSSETVHWMAEFTPFDDTTFEKRGYSKIILLLDMTAGAKVFIDVKEDNRPWKRVSTLVAHKKLLQSVPLRLGRCDRFRVRISGKGYTVIRGMEREYSAGSEV